MRDELETEAEAEHRRLVETGYDQMAEQYLATKDAADPVLLGALARFAEVVPAGAPVLDLGCGAGVPVTAWLAERYAVTGVDVSARQLALARQHVPGGTFIKSNMSALDFPPGSLAGVTAFYSIIHVPRAEQPALVARIDRWLRPGGAFLATWALTEWEGAEANWEGWGAPMWWSHYDQAANLALLQATGFALPWAEVLPSGDETWLWVLAQRAMSDER
jgi:SAM-dependent methyltransferase